MKGGLHPEKETRRSEDRNGPGRTMKDTANHIAELHEFINNESYAARRKRLIAEMSAISDARSPAKPCVVLDFDRESQAYKEFMERFQDDSDRRWIPVDDFLTVMEQEIANGKAAGNAPAAAREETDPPEGEIPHAGRA